MSFRVHPPSRPKLRPLLAAALLVAWSVAHGQSCSFRNSGSAINFPPLDPSLSVTLTASMDIKLRCNPNDFTPTWGFSGANGSAPLRMKRSGQNAYIPYTVDAAYLNKTGKDQNWRVTGTVLAANYENALVGSYSDILTATILP